MKSIVLNRRDKLLKAELDALLRDADLMAFRRADPISLPWSFEDDADREVVALIAAVLAYGRVTSLKRAGKTAVGVLGPRPAESLRLGHWDRAALNDFVYRMTRGTHVVALFDAIAAALVEFGSLEALFMRGYSETDSDLRPALSAFVATLRTYGGSSERGFHYLLADPSRGGACKRLNLFLRWMVRGPDTVDFGLWSAVDASKLVMPLDTHVARIARNLGLSLRKSQDWKLAVQIRDSLARFDPDDPIKYDFPLCHMGISGACPSQHDPPICSTCGLQRHCKVGGG